ncbi:MAG: aryl-sulfate sulfotransferase, partial [Acidimicrobiaceae bacterium]|nr:aryl-sulfate sulfotransferase [Acidimicrobiaceae bacterium]
MLLTTPFHGSFYLVDNEGRKAYSWNAAGALGKLLDNGNLITGHNRSNVAEISPDGTAAWKYQTKNQHHDVIKLANGNYLFISSEYYTTAQAIAAGANPDCLDLNGLEVDSIIEMQPVGPSGGSIVWKWNVWDHLIQDFDSTKDNYGVVADHPELIDINYGLCQIHAGSNVYIKDPHHLTHLNAIDYNASLDQILITSRHFSEVWVIDHSTTTTQAASGSGGDSNMGGNLLYRYGNPRTHQNGSKSDQRLFFPHNAHWISSGLPGAGNILIYNNGHEHPGFLRNYASVDELAFPSSEHTYLRAGDGFMQPTLLWTHRLAEHTWIMSSAQRLPNGNTLITEGNHARISEVTPDGTVVWHYSNPLHPGKGILTEGSPPLFDSGYWTYRSYKYAADHPGIAALTLVPVADRTSLAVKCTGTVTPTSDDLIATVRGYHNNNKTSSNYDQSWFRVLISFGVESSDTLESFTVAEARAKENTSDDWTPIREELERRRAECVSSLTPVVSIAAGPSVTEGTAASFTLTAVPPPSVGMTVNVSVTSAGGFAAAATTTVTIPTSGTATLSVDTLDDDIHESDGSVTVTVDSGTGYSVDSVAAATVSVSDDEGSCTVTAPSDDLIQLVRGYHDSNRPKSGYNQNWLRVLIAFGAETSGTLEPFTAAEARNGEQVWDGWTPIRQELERLEQEAAQCATPAVPVVSIAAGGDVTEGGNAVFTLTADPVPAAQFDVTVIVATSGSYGVTAGTRTVTIPTSGTATLTLATTDDSTDEANGTITATLVDGAAYDLGSTATATVAVADNETPAVSITSAGDVTEGGNAVFTLTADPVPHASLDVTVTIATSGSYGVTAGTRTVTIPTSGTATLTLATTDDSTDEANGTITATLVDGAAYDLDTTATATINIADNDNSTPATPVVSIAAGGGITEGGNAVFTLVAAPAPAAQFDVTVTVATSGSYGVTAGTRTVTIP